MRIKILLLLLLGLGACKQPGASEEIQSMEIQNPATAREDRIQAHRDFLKKEVESIQNYIEDRDLALERNGTGIYFQLDSLGAGPNPQPGDIAEYRFKISMLNGALLYQSSPNSHSKLRIDREDAEIGLHEALKLMRVGDKGLFILPSHRAFGVAGDQNKIPPFTALVYELELIAIQKQNP